jgi:hypothetical protein
MPDMAVVKVYRSPKNTGMMKKRIMKRTTAM